MTSSAWHLLTDGVLLACIACLLVCNSRERARRHQDAAARRARMELGRRTWDSVGRP